MSDTFPVSGYLEIHSKGFGFLRQVENNLRQSPEDCFVPAHFIKKNSMEDGTFVEAQAIHAKGKPAPAIKTIEKLNGYALSDFRQRKPFHSGDAISPYQWLRLKGGTSTRIIDLISPIGKGQRAIIAAPPRSGKTVLIEQMIKAIETEHPECICLVLLIDERPEEVTHFRRSFPNTTIMASSNDNEAMEHITLARQTFGIAKAMVEQGKDVIIFMDSLTRLCRTFNSQQRGGGRTLSGGLDTNALVEPKKMFGLARQIEDGGSLTIVATALVETDSKMDEVIFREFKGTGNMELVLDRDLADRNIYPAININPSGTRNEHRLFGREINEQVQDLRCELADCRKQEAIRQLISLVKKYPTNEEFLKLQ